MSLTNASAAGEAARASAGPRRLVLASRSPRRVQLLRDAGFDFEIDPADVDEANPDRLAPEPLARHLALLKARTTARRHPGQVVLAADTLVALGDAILNKPDDADDARRMLAALAGTSHLVITAVAVMAPACESIVRAATSRCRMKPLTPEQIDAYVRSGDWAGKAGGYGIQDGGGTVFAGDPFVERIDGSYTNIVGLPLELVIELLAGVGVFPRA